MRILSSDSALYLLDPHDIEQHLLPRQISAYRSHLEEVINWAHTYLCHSHASLGRDGPVCPYTQPSLDRMLFWLTLYPGPNPNLEAVSISIRKYRDWFLELEPTLGKEMQYKAILVLFPDVVPLQAPGIIDTVHSTLKPEFIVKGTMIGQFHARCEEPALWNQDFRPFRSPVPLLAIRYMVPTDFLFLKREASWLMTYLQRFGSSVPSRLRAAVREAALRFGLEYPEP